MQINLFLLAPVCSADVFPTCTLSHFTFPPSVALLFCVPCSLMHFGHYKRFCTLILFNYVIRNHRGNGALTCLQYLIYVCYNFTSLLTGLTLTVG